MNDPSEISAQKITNSLKAILFFLEEPKGYLFAKKKDYRLGIKMARDPSAFFNLAE